MFVITGFAIVFEIKIWIDLVSEQMHPITKYCNSKLSVCYLLLSYALVLQAYATHHLLSFSKYSLGPFKKFWLQIWCSKHKENNIFDYFNIHSLLTKVESEYF